MKQLGRSVGRAGDYNHLLFSLSDSFFSLSPPRVHAAALRYSKATAAADSSAALPLTSAPLSA